MKLEVLMKKAILIIFALLLACSDISHAAQDRYILRFGTTLTPGNAIFNAVEHFTKAVNEKTQGRATVQLFHSGSARKRPDTAGTGHFRCSGFLPAPVR